MDRNSMGDLYRYQRVSVQCSYSARFFWKEEEDRLVTHLCSRCHRRTDWHQWSVLCTWSHVVFHRQEQSKQNKTLRLESLLLFYQSDVRIRSEQWERTRRRRELDSIQTSIRVQEVEHTRECTRLRLLTSWARTSRCRNERHASS